MSANSIGDAQFVTDFTLASAAYPGEPTTHASAVCVQLEASGQVPAIECEYEVRRVAPPGVEGENCKEFLYESVTWNSFGPTAHRLFHSSGIIEDGCKWACRPTCFDGM